MTSGVEDGAAPAASFDAIVVLCAVPAGFDGEGLAAALVEQSLAACVQVTSSVTSTYRWKGAIERSDERLLIIKTRREVFSRLEAAIQAAHPYDVPEIIALSVSGGHAPYLAWLADSTPS